ncbi:MAG: hypothetical protein ABFS34_03865 [Gemmatimonadota bacterium]
MDDQRPDRDLRELFDELRTEDAQAAPDFPTLTARARAEGRRARPVRTKRLLLTGGLLAAAATAAVMLVGRAPISDEGFEEVVTAYASDPLLGAFRSPTDALLAVPGGEIVTTIPRVGDVSTVFGVSGLTRRVN